MEKLKDDQLEAFDTEYVHDQRWAPIARCIDRDFADRPFTFLDIGGGNGIFADRVLAHYPNARGVVLDNAQMLLDRNKPQERKRVVLGSAEDLATCCPGEHFDLIFFNWVLHHLVDGSSFSNTRRYVDQALHGAKGLLASGGRISIFENMYNGLVLDGLPGWLVYQLTSAKAIAGLVRRGGANTAGAGVCFRSRRQWEEVFNGCGLQILDYTDDKKWKIPLAYHVFLHIGNLRCGHLWLA
jgi:hypothetical protein